MRKNDVTKLINAWQERNIISVEQADIMRNDVNDEVSHRSGNLFTTMVMYIGATALSLGVLLFIASNWEHLTKGMKVFMALALPISLLSFAYWQLCIKQSTKLLGRAMSIVGLAAIGGSFAIVGQIYHIEANMTTFFASWTAFATPFAFMFRRVEHSIAFLALVSATFWLWFFEVFIKSVDGAIEDSTLIMITTVTGFLYAGVMYLGGAYFRNQIGMEEFFRVFRLLSAVVVLAIAFVMTFDEYAKVLMDSGYYGTEWILPAIIFNLMFIGLMMFVIVKAIKHEEYHLAFTTIRLFALYFLVKYFVLFNKMLDTSVLFIVGGILFIAGGIWLERNKDRLQAYMKQVQESSRSSIDVI
ncbi:DUF2157 domain-containing protein [Candidatus Kaiserbacteria bacterium]|nr:DUF2157 domain-containing protein [Candidatus Kaiserbacteria bacterium]